jgi:hypothetical protein
MASQGGSGAQPEARQPAIRAQPDLTNVMHIPGDARIPQARAGWPRSIGNQTTNAFSLCLPERRDFSRWAGMTIIAAHAAIVASVVLWDVARRSNPTSFPPSL